MLTYAQLVSRVYPRRMAFNAFEGTLLKPGALIDEAELWPTPDYPVIPLLLEYAGNDSSGWGHRRSKDIYLLWRYDCARHEWIELVRCVSEATEWLDHLRPVALMQLARNAPPADPSSAASISARIIGALDQELERLDGEDRHLVMSFVYQAFSARAVSY
jgi:hypothetical protein